MISENRYRYQSLVDFAGFYIYSDKNAEDVEYNEICSKQIDVSVKTFLIKLLLMSLGGFAAISGPAHVYITNGIKTTTTDLRIPFTEAGSNVEFIANLIFQFNICIHGWFVYVGIEVLVSVIENLITLTPNWCDLNCRN